MNAILECREVRKYYAVRHRVTDFLWGGARRPDFRALDGVSLQLCPGRVLGIVGESGSGKSTLANLLVGLDDATGGEVRFRQTPIGSFRRAERRAFRRQVQMVFQDPFGSLNPRLTVGKTVEEPLIIHGMPAARRRARVVEALGEAELQPAELFLDRFPHQLSGGQRQRVAIARAIVLGPSVLVADEPVSMLDVSVRAGVLRLMRRLVDDHRMALLFITHDLAQAGQICDDLIVLYKGRVVEAGHAAEVLTDPRHPYTRELISAMPVPGMVDTRTDPSPDPAVAEEGAGTGCSFAHRCVQRGDECLRRVPELRPSFDSRRLACHQIG